QNDRKLLDKLIDIRSGETDDEDGSATDAKYAQAFREAGIDVVALPPAEAGTKIKARSDRVASTIAAAVDHWAAVRRSRRKDGLGAERLTDVARSADPNPWRNQLRHALGLPKGQRELDTLHELVRSAKIDGLPPVSLNLLGSALLGAGDPTTAEGVLR